MVPDHALVGGAVGARAARPRTQRRRSKRSAAPIGIPLYAYVRRQGHSPADAQDLTQEFFARLLQKEYLHSVTRAKGKFRTFLLVVLKRFLADEWDKARAQKRGGGQVFCVDWSSAETRFLQQPVEHLTPEKVFEQRWALTLLDQVYARLEREYQEQGRGALFDALRFALTGSRSDVPYAELARQLQTTEGAVRVAVHRLRQRYRELLRQAIADTVRPRGSRGGAAALARGGIRVEEAAVRRRRPFAPQARMSAP